MLRRKLLYLDRTDNMSWWHVTPYRLGKIIEKWWNSQYIEYDSIANSNAKESMTMDEALNSKNAKLKNEAI